MKSERVARVALSTFFNIMREWSIKETQQIALLAAPSPKVFKDWNNNIVTSLNPDTLIRISYIIRIYKYLGILFPKRKQANDWIWKPNKDLEGASAINIMSSGQLSKMHQVVEYLNNQLK